MVFSLANKENLLLQQCITDFFSPQEAVNNQAMTQSHFAGVKTSITENQDQWADHMRKWIPEEYQTAA